MTINCLIQPTGGIMHIFHTEVVKLQRWDLTARSRETTYIYLN